MSDFAARLRADREKAGLTVRDLADQSGISFSYITKIETGRAGKGVSPEIVTTLATALGSDILEYLFLSGVVPSPLNDLLSNEQSRSFVHALLGSRMKSSGWDRLQSALADQRDGKSASEGKMPVNRVKKSRRKSVA